MPETLQSLYRAARCHLKACHAWADTARLTLALYPRGGLPRIMLEDLISACQEHDEEGEARFATHALVAAWRLTPPSGEHNEEADRQRRTRRARA